MVPEPPAESDKAASIFGALAYPNFRIYWISAVSFVLGWQILRIVFAWIIYELTGSALYLGVLGGVQAAGTLSVVLIGGVIADRVDRRVLLLMTQGSMTATVAGLLVLAQIDQLAAWHLLVASAVIGVAQGIDQPARTSLIPALIPDRRQLMNALALGSSVWQGTRIFGPAVGGIILEISGVTWTFGLVALGFVAGTLLLLLLQVPPVIERRRESFVRELVEGLAFIRSRQLFFNLIALTFIDSFFGTAYIYVMPIFAKDILGLGASGMGMLMSASAAGALLGTLGAAFVIRGRWPVPLLLGGAGAFGALTVVFAVSNLLPLSLAVLFLSGAFNSVSMITNQTILQAAVPEELRGRVMGVFSLTYSLIPLGGLQVGIVTDYLGAQAAVAIGGVVVVGFTAFLMFQSSFRKRVSEAAMFASPEEATPTPR